MATPGHSPPRLDQSSLSCVCRNAEKSELPRPECLSVAPVSTALPKHWDTPAWTHCKTHYGVRRRIVTPRSLPSRTSVSVESPHSGASAGRSGIGATLSPEAVPSKVRSPPDLAVPCRYWQGLLRGMGRHCYRLERAAAVGVESRPSPKPTRVATSRRKRPVPRRSTIGFDGRCREPFQGPL